MKHYFLLLSLACALAGQAQAQFKGAVPPSGLSIAGDVSQMLNATSDGKIKTIELPQIDNNFDNNPYNEGVTKYLAAMNGWKGDYKANLLGTVNLKDGGMLYFYTVITPSKQYQVRYGVRLVRTVDGTMRNCHYDVSDFMDNLYARPSDAVYKTDAVKITINKLGKTTSFTVVTKGSTGTFETAYTLATEEADTNSKWITTFSKNKK